MDNSEKILPMYKEDLEDDGGAANCLFICIYTFIYLMLSILTIYELSLYKIELIEK